MLTKIKMNHCSLCHIANPQADGNWTLTIFARGVFISYQNRKWIRWRSEKLNHFIHVSIHLIKWIYIKMFITPSFSSPTRLGIDDFSFIRFTNKPFWSRKWILYRSAHITFLYERFYKNSSCIQLNFKVKRLIQNLKCILFRFFTFVIHVCNP